MLQPATSVLESPSFNGYSSSRLAEIAARVVNQPHDDHFFNSNLRATDTELQQQQTQKTALQEYGKDLDVQVTNVAEEQELQEGVDDDSFEFSIVRQHEQASLSADEIFQSGHIRPIFPFFNTDLINGVTNYTTPRGDGNNQAPAVDARVLDPTSAPPAIRHTLKKLLMKEQQEADHELESLPPETYCIWTPKNDTDNREIVRKKKRKSGGGSSKEIPETDERRCCERKIVAGDGERAAKAGSDRRRSYLPDRRVLVGFFHHVNRLTRVIHRF
ncbi:hypothetical protein Droror1_Dr00004478 [Drosera rotundifolia]